MLDFLVALMCVAVEALEGKQSAGTVFSPLYTFKDPPFRHHLDHRGLKKAFVFF